jgi:hypothetical protein
MTLNSLVLRFRITINSVDVTASARSDGWFTLNSPKFSEDGLFQKRGTITLLPVQGFAANFFSPRKNAIQWARGKSVLVELDFDGSYTTLFTGFILKKPATPTDQFAPLVISVGCELAYRDRDAVAGDLAGVTLGTSTTRTDIIDNIWTGLNGTGAWSGTMADYPIPYNLPKHTGSYVQQMGDIAASAAYGLYCDRSGALQAAKFSLNPSALETRTNSNSFLAPVDGSETPAEQVTATVVGREVSATPLTRTIGPLIESGTLLTRLGYGLSSTQVVTGTKKETTITETWAASKAGRSPPL